MTAIRHIGKYYITADCAIAIKSADSKSLFIRSDFTPDPSSTLAKLIERELLKKVASEVVLKAVAGGGLNIEVCDGKPFDEYKFFRTLLERGDHVDSENDCLNFAEFLGAAGRDMFEVEGRSLFPYKFAASIYQAKENRKIFGYSDKLNMALLKTIPADKKNNYAVPKPGEAYAIVMTKKDLNLSPYHIAGVIYNHNGVNLTIEAAALEEGHPDLDFQPEFSLYDTEPNGATFHKKYAQVYTVGETIVLEPRSTETLTREILQEIRPKQKKRPRNYNNNNNRNHNRNRTVKRAHLNNTVSSGGYTRRLRKYTQRRK